MSRSGSLGLDVEILRRLSSDRLVRVLEDAPGAKDLIIDGELMKMLDRIAGATLLRKHGVQKMYRLERLPPPIQSSQRVYVVRPTLVTMKYVADHVHADSQTHPEIRVHVVVVPRITTWVTSLVEEEGLFGIITMHEFTPDFIPLDDDLLSLEMNSFYRDAFLDGDYSSCLSIARGLQTIQGLYGSIPNVVAHGRAAKAVLNALDILTEQGSPTKSNRVVHCQETACTAVLQQPCGHEVCRSHARCAVQVADLLVWHPDGCEICYALVSDVTSDSVSPAITSATLETLKTWVGGFGRNVKAKHPYILAEEMCSLLYPNAKISAAVMSDVAAPIITRIREETQAFPDDLVGLGDDVLDDVAAINLDVEPMVVDSTGTGRVVGEAGSVRSKVPFPSPAHSLSSSVSSFQGFTGKVVDKSCSVVPKVKHVKKNLPKASKILKSLPVRPSSTFKRRPVSEKVSPTAQGSRVRNSKAKSRNWLLIRCPFRVSL
ncbi:uncharacterized protein [Palaemon carinicauda]|uniref:uncharacterized protein isoform X2 n=1 Tax=Palaemon carinicauda TaxID=392227 RepID=UPI0035B6209E